MQIDKENIYKEAEKKEFPNSIYLSESRLMLIVLYNKIVVLDL